MKKKTLVTVGIILVAVMVTATTALAANGNFRFADDKKTVTTDAATESVRHQKGFGFHLDVAVTDEQKAEALKQIKEKLDEQVASGKLTQAQADEMYNAMKDGEFSISVRPNGDLKDIPKLNGNFTEPTEEQKADMLAKLKEHLDKLVSDGKLTQEQADEMYAKSQNGEMFRFSPDKGGHGSRSSGGGRKGPPSETSDTASATVFRPV